MQALPAGSELAARRPALQVVAYGISINLVEVTWKSKIKAQFPNPNDYSAFMGDFSTATGAPRAAPRRGPSRACVTIF